MADIHAVSSVAKRLDVVRTVNQSTGVHEMNGGEPLNYKCPKCNHSQYELGEFRASGGFWTKIFDIQSRRYSTVTCAQCRYTEIFQADSSMLGNVFDFFTN
jgi:predicted nucleic-acid-binding Zn-ribbon protein